MTDRVKALSSNGYEGQDNEGFWAGAGKPSLDEMENCNSVLNRAQCSGARGSQPVHRGAEAVKILLGCDVDPVLPPLLEQPPTGDIWGCLAHIDELVRMANDTLPPITWLIRSDDSIRFCTGDFASGYRSKQTLWRSLEARGHELGWHVHTWSFDEHRGCFLFEPVPPWLAAAHAALADCFSVRATRTGWGYGSTALFQRLDQLGVIVDFSALPGYVVWHRIGPEDVKVDWLRCPATARTIPRATTTSAPARSGCSKCR